jgi:hypothetical protein
VQKHLFLFGAHRPDGVDDLGRQKGSPATRRGSQKYGRCRRNVAATRSPYAVRRVSSTALTRAGAQVPPKSATIGDAVRLTPRWPGDPIDATSRPPRFDAAGFFFIAAWRPAAHAKSSSAPRVSWSAWSPMPAVGALKLRDRGVVVHRHDAAASSLDQCTADGRVPPRSRFLFLGGKYVVARRNDMTSVLTRVPRTPDAGRARCRPGHHSRWHPSMRSASAPSGVTPDAVLSLARPAIVAGP